METPTVPDAGRPLLLDGADLRVTRAGEGILRIDARPLAVSDLYRLFPEIIDGAFCAVTVYGEPSFFSGRIRDEIGNKFQTDLLDQRERLEFFLTDRLATEEELRAALAVGPDHELFGGAFFHGMSWRDRHTAVFCREDAGVVEKLVPWFLRRPWFQTPEKHVRTDPFVLPKFLPAAREGIHVAAGRVTLLEEGDAAVAGVGPFAAQPLVTPERRRAMGGELETLRYASDAEGNLKLVARERAAVDAWLAKDADAWTPGAFPTGIVVSAVGAAGIAAGLAGAGTVQQAGAGIACLAAATALAVFQSRRTARARLASVAFREIRLERLDGGLTRFTGTIGHDGGACIDLFQGDLVLADDAGAEVARAPVLFPLLPPRTRYPFTADLPDPDGRAASARLEPLREA